MKLFPRSIRWRIQLWHGLLLVAVLAGFGFTAFRLERDNELRRIDRELQEPLALLHKALNQGAGDGPGNRPPPSLRGRERPRPRGLFLPEATAARFGGSDGLYYVAWTRTGEEFGRAHNAPATVEMPARDATALAVNARMDGVRREAFIFTPPGECLLVGRSIEAESGHLARLGWWFVLLGGAVLAAGLLGGWWLAAGATRPIEQIAATAARISRGKLSERIDVAETESELGRLATVLNETFAKLDAAFAQQARFTADAAHELRTPVSVVLSDTQHALARERTPGEYRETIEVCQRAARRMEGLIESLLTLAQLETPTPPIALRACDLAAVAREGIEALRPLAKERQVMIATDLATAPCVADAPKISQVVTNLLANAVKYNRPGGEVRVATAANGTSVRLTVADTGLGIAAEHLPHIFERFYRGDPSRNRETGGAGLGLAICKTIAEAHGGRITVESKPGAGTTCTLELPHSPQESSQRL